MIVQIDLVKAKEIAHNIRRADRDNKLKPHDLQIAAQIPGVDLEAEETARQVVRNENAVVQVQIDDAQDADELKSILDAL